MIRKWINRFLNSGLVRWVFSFARAVKPWGFEGLSLYAVSKFFIEGLQKGAVSTRAAAISYRLIISLFPVVIVLFSSLPYIPVEGFQEILFESIKDFFPGDTFSYIEEKIAVLFEKGHSSIISIGSVLSIFYASSSVNAIIQGFNGSYHLEQKGNAFFMRLISVALFIGLGILVIVAVSIIIFSGMLFDQFLEMGWVTENLHFLLSVAKYVVSVLLIYASITILYNIGDHKNKAWKTFSAGATFTTVLFLLTSIGFSWFVSNFNTYSALYSTLGNFLLLLVWLNLNCNILLLGFELNTSIYRAKLDLRDTTLQKLEE